MNDVMIVLMNELEKGGIIIVNNERIKKTIFKSVVLLLIYCCCFCLAETVLYAQEELPECEICENEDVSVSEHEESVTGAAFDVVIDGWRFERNYDKSEYSGYKVGKIRREGDSTKLIIPSKIDGYDVIIKNASTGYTDPFFPPDVTEIVFEEGVKIDKSCSDLFIGCDCLKEVDLSGVDMSNVTNYESMFYGCESIEKIRFGDGFDACMALNIDNMFYGCKKLNELDFEHFNSGKLLKLEDVFSGCESIESIDLSGLRTENVTRMTGLFSGCKKLKSIDISHFNTSNVTTMRYLFSGCESLESVDLRNFDTSNVTDMFALFSNCRKLKIGDIPGIYSLNTNNVTDMTAMFLGCDEIENTYFISSFNTQNVMTMRRMFADCKNLKIASLKGLNLESLDDNNYMFYGCTNLKVVDLSDTYWKGYQIHDASMIFWDCDNLVMIDMSNSINIGLGIQVLYTYDIPIIKTPKSVKNISGTDLSLKNEYYEYKNGKYGTERFFTLEDAPANSVIAVKGAIEKYGLELGEEKKPISTNDETVPDGGEYPSNNDNYYLVVSGNKINKLILDLSGVEKAGVSPDSLRITVLKGSVIKTYGVVKAEAEDKKAVKVKVSNGVATVKPKKDGKVKYKTEDGKEYTVEFIVETPKAQKAAKTISVDETKTVELSIADMFGTTIDKGSLKIEKEKVEGQAEVDNSKKTIVITPRKADVIKVVYCYLNKKYKLTIKVK